MTRDRAVGAYYLYMATSNIGFMIPVWVVLLEDRGLTLTSIATLEAAFFLALLLSEVPTGYLGDRLGRRTTMVASTVLLAAGALVYPLVETVWAFLPVYVVWAVGETLRSGNDSAWLYDTLAHHGEVGTFGRVRSRGLALLLGAGALTAVAGGWLYTVDPRYPFFATAGMQVVAGLTVLAMPAVTVAGSEQFTLRKARAAASRLVRPELRWVVAIVAAFWAIGWTADLYVQPVGTRAGVDPFGLGILYAVLTGASAVAANYADTIARRVGATRTLVLAPLLTGLVLLSLAVTPLAFVPAVLVTRMVLTGSGPVVETYLNDRVPSLGRATVLSTLSMAVSLVSIPVKLTSGPLADAASPFVAVAALGGVLVLAVLAVLVVDGRSIVARDPAVEPTD